MAEYAQEDLVQMPSGLLLPAYIAEEQIQAMQRPKAFDFFCGCGGSSLGFIQAGWEVVGALDWETDAALTYMTNLGTYPMKIHFGAAADRARLEKSLSRQFKRNGNDQLELPMVAGSGWIQHQDPRPPGVQHFWLADITKIKGRDLLDVLELEVGELDAVVGSPPCQGFSRANKNSGKDDLRNNLVFEWARLVCEMRPKTCIMENVPGIVKMLTPDGLPLMDVLMRILEDGNFAAVDAMRRSMVAQGVKPIMRSGPGKSPRKKK